MRGGLVPEGADYIGDTCYHKPWGYDRGRAKNMDEGKTFAARHFAKFHEGR
jgi:hypothetical protein